jgi:hypothetical protein
MKSTPDINTGVWLALIAPPAAIASAIAAMLSLVRHDGDNAKIIVAETVSTANQFATDRFARLSADRLPFTRPRP